MAKKSLTQKKKSKKRNVNRFVAIWANPSGRSLLILVLIAIFATGGLLYAKYFGTDRNVSTFKYSQGNTNLSFQYPTDFTDNTKPSVFGGGVDFVAQQSKKDASGATTGYIRATYTPVDASSSNGSSTFFALQAALEGNGDAIKTFNNDSFISQIADCSDDNIIHTQSGGKALECNYTKDYASLFGSEYTGKIVYGASSYGIYEFDFLVSTTYRNAHPSWDKLYSGIDYR